MSKKNELNRGFLKSLAIITIFSIMLLSITIQVVDTQVKKITKEEIATNLTFLEFATSINSLPAIQKMAQYYGEQGIDNKAAQIAYSNYFALSCAGEYDEEAKIEAISLVQKSSMSNGAIVMCRNKNEVGGTGEHELYKEALFGEGINIELKQGKVSEY